MIIFACVITFVLGMWIGYGVGKSPSVRVYKMATLAGLRAQRDELRRQTEFHGGSSIYQRDQLEKLAKEIGTLETEVKEMEIESFNKSWNPLKEKK